MTHLSLFSGIGGLDLAAEKAGFKTVAFVERDTFCQRVLKKHWPEVPIYDDVTTFDGRRLRGVDLISGGFPCQPHSVAGKRLASGDERDLWGEVIRILGEAEPQWFVGENVPGLLSSESGRFFGRVVNDLASLGYRVGWSCYGASDVGACHRRKRVFIIAYLGGERCLGRVCRTSESVSGNTRTQPELSSYASSEGRRQEPRSAPGHETPHGTKHGYELDGVEQDASNPASVRLKGLPESGPNGQNNQEREGRRKGKPERSGLSGNANSQRLKEQPDRITTGTRNAHGGLTSDSSSCGLSGEPRRRAGAITEDRYRELPSRDWRTWDIKPVFRSGDDGVPDYVVRHRVNILKALGNAVVPQQAYPLFKAIADGLVNK